MSGLALKLHKMYVFLHTVVDKRPLFYVVVIIVNFIPISQYNLNQSKHNVVGRGHQRSPWVGGLKCSHIYEATQVWAVETWNNETQLTIKVQSEVR